jgi:uncharacterized coiled-coil DUF342 family protein
MLSKGEEYRVFACIEVLTHDIEKGDSEGLELETQLWLADKLREINNEAAHYSQELQNTNEALIACYEGHDR